MSKSVLGQLLEMSGSGQALRLAGIAITSVLLASCASMVTTTQFLEYHGANVTSGSGGTKRTVNGIDIWENGEPNCTFKILGFIQDEVLENRGAAPGTLNILNVASVASLAGREKRLAAEAKKHGADAIIYVAANREFLNAGQHETNFRNQVKILAVKYVMEEPSVGSRLGDTREQVESQLGNGEEIQLEKFGIKPGVNEPDAFKTVAYELNNADVRVVYYKGVVHAVALMYADRRSMTQPTITRLLRFFAQDQEWTPNTPSQPEHTLEWLRGDGNYWAVCDPDKGVFMVGNTKTLPIK